MPEYMNDVGWISDTKTEDYCIEVPTWQQGPLPSLDEAKDMARKKAARLKELQEFRKAIDR